MAVLLAESPALADGKVMAPADYQGSLEERAQEAILIFHGSRKAGGAREDLILKIRVEGEADHFAWIVPFPNEPKVKKEDPRLFEEIFNYVEARLVRRYSGAKSAGDSEPSEQAEAEKKGVEVLSRKIVGAFDVAVVRENEAGALNEWLEKEGYQTLTGDDADEVLEFYRQKKYVYACIKVSDVELSKGEPVDLHPLRFSFKTGGRDGMFYPMKLTGLQQQPFDVNLYVFYGKWVNDKLSKFGYENRGFRLRYRDWDSPKCEPNAGKKYSAPQNDAFLSAYGHHFPTLTKLLQNLHPGEQYYLTNLQIHGLKPEAVRNWADDLWLFPYYTDRDFVPYDVRPGGPASAAWPDAYSETTEVSPGRSWLLPGVCIAAGLAFCVAVCVGFGHRRGMFGCGCGPKAESDADCERGPTDAD